MTVTRYDSGKLGKLRKTPTGGVIAPAAISRTGVLLYHNPDGSERREYRPPEEVFNQDSLDSLQTIPVTNLHHGMINARNWRHAAVGNFVGSARREDHLVVGDLAVQDEETIRLMESGERKEVSAGYICDLEFTPGTTPEGERYDAVQRRIRYNHVALVPRGRAGAEVALRLDSAGNQAPVGRKEDPTMKEYELINGTRYEIGTEAHTKARQDAVDTEKELAKLRGELEAERAKTAQIQKRLDAFEAEKATAAKAALLKTAKDAGATVREDMSEDEIRRAVVSKVLPDMDTEGKGSEFLAGAFEVALATMGNQPGSAAKVHEDIVGPTVKPKVREDADAGLPPDEVARQAMIKKNQATNTKGAN